MPDRAHKALNIVAQSFQLFLDGVSPSEEHAVALAKLLATCFVIRGAQLAVVRRIDSQFVVKLHTDSITWLCKRISAYDTAGNKRARNKSILFFKLLLPLLSSIDSRDSLAMWVTWLHFIDDRRSRSL